MICPLCKTLLPAETDRHVLHAMARLVYRYPDTNLEEAAERANLEKEKFHALLKEAKACRGCKSF